ncbi:MAG: hypothetical protein GY804_12830 [Alphaproteobacteria bacterium]|nr:hypothetical protein [Alphaproteobacteria bacterium]
MDAVMKMRGGLILKSQSGRSMMEMLGVLAIVGVLSVGALAGYSFAMTKHKANQAINEIKDIVIRTKDLYANRNTYDGLTTGILQKAGIIGSPNTNVLGGNVFIMPWVVGTKSTFRLDYQTYTASDYKKTMCEKVLLHGWLNELGNDLISIYIYYGPNPSDAKGFHNQGHYALGKPGFSTVDYFLPATVDEASEACVNAATFILVMQ